MRTIQRNALISLINIDKKEEKYKKVLIEKLKDNSPIIRYYAYKAYIALNYNLENIKEIIKSEKEIDLENILNKEVKWCQQLIIKKKIMK